jgi:hypothetical protein
VCAARSRESAPRPCLDRNHGRALSTCVLRQRRRHGGVLREARRLEAKKAPLLHFGQAELIKMNGILYGTTAYGGANECPDPGWGCGTVLSVTTTGAEKVLHRIKRRYVDRQRYSGDMLFDDGYTLSLRTVGGGSSRNVRVRTPENSIRFERLASRSRSATPSRCAYQAIRQDSTPGWVHQLPAHASPRSRPMSRRRDQCRRAARYV